MYAFYHNHLLIATLVISRTAWKLLISKSYVQNVNQLFISLNLTSLAL